MIKTQKSPFTNSPQQSSRKFTQFPHLTLANILKNALYGYKIQDTQILNMKSQAIYDLKKFLSWPQRMKSKLKIPPILQKIKILVRQHLQGQCNCNNNALSFVDYLGLLKDEFTNQMQIYLQKQEDDKEQDLMAILKNEFESCIQIITLSDYLLRFWDEIQADNLIKYAFKQQQLKTKKIKLQQIEQYFKQTRKKISLKDQNIHSIIKKSRMKQQFNNIDMNNVFNQQKLYKFKKNIRYNPLVDVRPYEFRLKYTVKHNILQYIYDNLYEQENIDKEKYQKYRRQIRIHKGYEDRNKEIVKFIVNLRKVYEYKKQETMEQRKEEGQKERLKILQKIGMIKQRINIYDQQNSFLLDKLLLQWNWQQKQINQFNSFLQHFVKYSSRYWKALINLKKKQPLMKSYIMIFSIMINQTFKLSDKHIILDKQNQSINYLQPYQNCQQSLNCKCYISYLLNQGIFINQSKKQIFKSKLSSLKLIQNQLSGMTKFNIPIHLKLQLQNQFQVFNIQSKQQKSIYQISATKQIYGIILLKKSIFKNVVNDDLQNRYNQIKIASDTKPHSNQSRFNLANVLKKISKSVFQIYGEIIPTKLYVGNLIIGNTSLHQKLQNKNQFLKSKTGIKMPFVSTSLSLQNHNHQNQFVTQNLMASLQVNNNIIGRQNFRICSDYINNDLKSIIQKYQFIETLKSKDYIICVRTKQNRKREVINFSYKDSIYDDLTCIMERISDYYSKIWRSYNYVYVNGRKQRMQIPTAQSRFYESLGGLGKKQVILSDFEIKKYLEYYGELSKGGCSLLGLIVNNLREMNKDKQFDEEWRDLQYLFMNNQRRMSVVEQMNYDIEMSILLLNRIGDVRFEIIFKYYYEQQNNKMLQNIKKIIDFKLLKMGEYSLLDANKYKTLNHNINQIKSNILQWTLSENIKPQDIQTITINQIQATIFLKQIKIFHNIFLIWQKYAPYSLQPNYSQDQFYKHSRLIVKSTQNLHQKGTQQNKIKLYQLLNNQYTLINYVENIKQKLKSKSIQNLFSKFSQTKNNIQLSINKSIIKTQKTSKLKTIKPKYKSNLQLLVINSIIIKIIAKIQNLIKKVQLFSIDLQAIDLKPKFNQFQYALPFNDISYEYSNSDNYIKVCMRGGIYMKLNLNSKNNEIINSRWHMKKQRRIDLEVNSVMVYVGNNSKSGLYLRYVQYNKFKASKLRFGKEADSDSLFYLMEYNSEYVYEPKELEY